MSDERGRRGEDGGPPRDPDESQPDEPEFGSADWLFQQLAEERTQDAEGADTAEAEAHVDADADADADAEPAPFDELLGRPTQEPVREEEPAAEFPVAFNWNLTPGAGGDPLVESEPVPAEESEPEPVEESEPATEAAAPVTRPVEHTPALFEPVVPEVPEPEPEPDDGEPFTPPVRRSNYIEPVTGPASTVPTLEPTPPVEPAEPTEPTAAGSWVIEPEQPTPAAPEEPEQPRSIFDAPAPEDESESGDDGEQSHGLAALLGFGGSATDEPSGRSVIGDTTSVIPLDPDFRMPEATPPPPAEPPPAEPSSAESPSAESPSVESPPAEPPPAEPPPVEPPSVLPSEPDIPAAEAEVALGGIPSPATSPIDAESIAVASEPDGLARLFGDAAEEPERDDTFAGDGLGEAELAGEPEPELEPVPEVEPEPEAEPEPAAEAEGPQLVATTPFTVPPADVHAARAAHDVDATSAPITASTSASTSADGSATTPPAPPSAPGLWESRNNRILFTVVAALAVVLVLIGLFALGTRIPSWFGAAKPAAQPAASATPSAKTTPSPTPTPVPTVTPKPAAAVGAGTHPWDSLGGGECIQPFTSVWAEDFTVVDCATPHTAQLVYTNLLSADPAAPYPGPDALAQQVPGLCTAGGVIDLGAAGAYPDVQVTGSFPATEQQWKDGQRSYYCFASRVSGQPLTSSVAGPGPG
ncbi:hypothetical protein AB4Z18_00845 [Leifsonia sp. 2TAF2]|uniref:hypothetical protein n=1 Tax=Leifsonia sp. 2TAF2 TaxID=3233009 RepID=UPI003F9E6ADF